MKLTKQQKSELKVLRKMADDSAVHTIYDDINSSVTVAFYYPFTGSKTVEVAVSYIDPFEDDRFRKSTGQYFVLKRIFNGKTVTMPVVHDDLFKQAAFLAHKFKL